MTHSATQSNQRGIATASVVLGAGFLLFVVAIGYLLVSSMAPRQASVFDPSPIDPLPNPTDTLIFDTVTVDSHDPVRWHLFDFDRGSVVLPPDTAGWDLAVRRFTVVSADAVADLGEVAFADVAGPPETGFIATTFGRDTVNTAIERWYRYSMVSHLLEPNGHIYVVRTREGRYAKIEFLSYYCPGMVGGCPTFRYVYQPADHHRFVP